VIQHTLAWRNTLSLENTCGAMFCGRKVARKYNTPQSHMSDRKDQWAKVLHIVCMLLCLVAPGSATTGKRTELSNPLKGKGQGTVDEQGSPSVLWGSGKRTVRKTNSLLVGRGQASPRAVDVLPPPTRPPRLQSLLCYWFVQATTGQERITRGDVKTAQR
jgi:hypothetical protein